MTQDVETQSLAGLVLIPSVGGVTQDGVMLTFFNFPLFIVLE
jgi:hypothetical protein